MLILIELRRKKKFVAQHRVDNPQKAAYATSTAVQKYRLDNPQKAADAGQSIV